MALARTPSRLIPAADAVRARSLARALAAPAMLLLAAGLCLAAMAMPVVQSSDAAATGYTIRQRQTQLADLTAQDQGLQDDLANLVSASRVRQAALALGMVPAPSPAAYVTVDAPAPADDLTMPRAYLLQAEASAAAQAPATTPAPAHSLLWRGLHLLHLR